MKTFLFFVLLLQAQAFNTVVPEKSYADPPTGDFVTNGIITPLDQEMWNLYIRNADGAIEVQLTPNAKVGLVLDTLGREKESLSLHSVSENDLKFNPAALSGRDPGDFLDLLTKDACLRKYNRH